MCSKHSSITAQAGRTSQYFMSIHYNGKLAFMPYHLQPVQKFLLQVNQVFWKMLQDSTTESLVSLKKKGLLIFYLRWASKQVY